MLVFFSVILTGILGFCGLALDVGRMEQRTVALQAAADAAALTAASEYQRGSSNWQSIAAADALSNETQNNIATGATFAVQQGASSGPLATDNLALQVTITQPLSLLFLGLVTGSTTTTVKVRSVALVPPCAFFTSTPGVSTLNAGLSLTNATVSAPCPVYARSGFVVNSSSTLNTGQTRSTGSSGASQMQGSVSPTTTYSTPSLADPLAYLTTPVLSSCQATGATFSGTATAYPATYCGGITITNSNVTLEPGLYIITGGVSFSNSTITGNGVTMYFTKGGGYGYGTVSISNNTIFKITAPTSTANGGIPGVSLYFDRNWSGGTQDFSLSSSTYQGDGIIYSLGTGINDTGTNLSGTNYFNLVVANLSLSGATATLSDNYASLSGGNPLHIPASLVQ